MESWGVPQIRDICGGPYTKDYGILGVYIGVPLFWETTSYRSHTGAAIGVHFTFRAD